MSKPFKHKNIVKYSLLSIPFVILPNLASATIPGLPTTQTDLVCSSGYVLEKFSSSSTGSTLDSDNNLLRLTVGGGENFETVSHTNTTGIKFGSASNVVLSAPLTLTYLPALLGPPESFKLHVVDVDSTGSSKHDYAFVSAGGANIAAVSAGTNIVAHTLPSPAITNGYQAVLGSGNAQIGNNPPWHVGFATTTVTDGLVFNLNSGFTGSGSESWVDFQACIPTSAPASADISVTKSLSSTGPFSPGQTVSYTVTVSNAGPDDATNVVVEDLPTNLTITNVSSANCSNMPCTIPAISAGSSETIIVEATAP